MARKNSHSSSRKLREHRKSLDPSFAGRTKQQGFDKNGDKYKVEYDKHGYRYDVCQERGSGKEYRIEYDKNGKPRDNVFYRNGDRKEFNSVNHQTPRQNPNTPQTSQISPSNLSPNPNQLSPNKPLPASFKHTSNPLSTPNRIEENNLQTSSDINQITPTRNVNARQDNQEEFVPTPVQASSQEIRESFLARREHNISSTGNKYIDDPNHPDYVPLSERLKARAQRK